MLPFVLIGHEKIHAYFEEAIKSGTLSQVYCFIGPSEVGKRAMAQTVARRLLQAAGPLVGHPDYHEISRVMDEKTGKLKRDISIAQARELRERLQARSWSGGYQVLIIDEAETLSAGAANALLKVLEEPPEKTVIFLIVENEQELLATIRSRAQSFYFSLLPASELRVGLQAAPYPADAVEKVLPYSGGRPGRAVRLLQSNDEFHWYTAETERWQALLGKPFYQKLAQIEPLFKEEDSVRARGELQRVLGHWMTLWREALLQKAHINSDIRVLPKLPVTVMNIPASRMRAIIDQIMVAVGLLDQNVHPRLVMENVIVSF